MPSRAHLPPLRAGRVRGDRPAHGLQQGGCRAQRHSRRDQPSDSAELERGADRSAPVVHYDAKDRQRSLDVMRWPALAISSRQVVFWRAFAGNPRPHETDPVPMLLAPLPRARPAFTGITTSCGVGVSPAAPGRLSLSFRFLNRVGPAC
jgi:hypothetical protein